MKKLLTSYAAKFIAFILSVLTGAASLFLVLGVGYLAKHGAYTKPCAKVQESASRSLLYGLAADAVNFYEARGALGVRELLEGTNLRISICDENYNKLLDTNDGAPIRFTQHMTYEYWLPYGEYGEENTHVTYNVDISVTEELKYEDEVSILLGYVETAYRNRWTIPILAVVAFAAFAALAVFLVCGTGHKRGVDGIALGLLDRIPLEIFLLICAGFVLLSLWVWYDYGEGTLLAYVMIYITVLFALRGVIVRIKAGTLFGNTLIKRCGGYARSFMRRLRSFLAGIPLAPITAVLAAAMIFLQIIMLLLAANDYDSGVVIYLILALASAVLAVLASIDLAKLKRGVERIALGELDHRLDPKEMHGRFRQLAESLNDIGAGMSRAVDERMRSERLRTELITNVSHDIKTPLTSIINYVDIIKKRGSSDEGIAECIEVLDRQSARLRKLVDDLLEASKASTGNIAVELDKCDLCLLMEQTVGEYRQRLSERGIEPVLSCPETAVNVLADGRHMWRVIDNLFNNVIKYAQSGTRLYVNVDGGKCGTVTIRNISAAALNISGEELTERFVRGDGSRHTEGSGLGLSIARSLMELQGGRLVIDIDGDLFKTTLTLNAV